MRNVARATLLRGLHVSALSVTSMGLVLGPLHDIHRHPRHLHLLIEHLSIALQLLRIEIWRRGLDQPAAYFSDTLQITITRFL